MLKKVCMLIFTAIGHGIVYLFIWKRLTLSEAWQAIQNDPLRPSNDPIQMPQYLEYYAPFENKGIKILYMKTTIREEPLPPIELESFAFVLPFRRGQYSVAFANGRPVKWEQNGTELRPDRTTQELWLANRILIALREVATEQAQSP